MQQPVYVRLCSVSEIDKFKYSDVPAELMITSLSCTAAYPKGALARVQKLACRVPSTARAAQQALHSIADCWLPGVRRSVHLEAWPGRVRVRHAQAIAEGAQPL